MIPLDELVLGNQVQRPGNADKGAVVNPPLAPSRPRLPVIHGTPSEMVVKLFEQVSRENLADYLAHFEEDERATHTGCA